jgi:hypothetical protein
VLNRASKGQGNNILITRTKDKVKIAEAFQENKLTDSLNQLGTRKFQRLKWWAATPGNHNMPSSENVSATSITTISFIETTTQDPTTIAKKILEHPKHLNTNRDIHH